MTRWIDARARVAALAGILGLAACGNAASTVSVADADADAAQRQITAVAQVVYGTSEQRSAGERRVYLMFQGGVADCMGKKGYTYDAPSFDDFTVPGSRRTMLHSPWLASPSDSLGAGRNVQRWAEVMTGRDSGGQSYQYLDADGRQAYDKALDHCDPANGYENSQFPDATWVAMKGLNAIAGEVDSAMDDRHGKEDAACMAEAGVDVADYYELYEQVDGAYAPYRQRSLAGLSAAAAWDAGAAFEAKAAAADAACRTEAYGEAVVLAAPLVQEWADSHADLLTSVTQQWQQLEQTYGTPATG